MTVAVHLFAAARDLVGMATVAVELPDGATVAGLRDALANGYANLGPLLTRCAVAVNQEYAEDSTPLTSADEVAVIPPVSGG